jgi:hypothetical protein
MTNQEEIQLRFVHLLTKLTESAKVEWARSKSDIGFVCCLVRDELIVFEVRGDAAGSLVDPTGAVAGIVGKCRNTLYLWLEPTPGFGDLLELLRRAPIDNERVVQFRKQVHLAPLKVLESLL